MANNFNDKDRLLEKLIEWDFYEKTCFDNFCSTFTAFETKSNDNGKYNKQIFLTTRFKLKQKLLISLSY